MARIATLADKQAVEREMPWEDRLAARSLYEQLTTTASRFPDRPAISFQLRSGPRDKRLTLTWAETRAQVTQAANLFRRLGIGPADTVAYVLPNAVETAVVLLAGATAGVVAPVNPLLSVEHMAEILRECGARVVVTLQALPEDRPRAEGRRRGGARPRGRDRARGRPRPRPRAAARLDRAADPAEARGAAPGARPRPGARDGEGERRRARLRRDPRRPGLHRLPHRRHHRHAEGRPPPGARHPLQRLVRPVLHVHRSRRADVPAAAVPRLRRLPDPDVLPGLRRRRW